MTLPPGRARLATKPAPTGSPAFVITMGMVVVAFLAANAGGVPVTTIRSTLRRTRSAASSGRRSCFCSANRYSMVIFFPSIHPSLLSSCRNASRGPRYRKQCLHPGNLCGRFFPAAARRRREQSAKSMAQSQRQMDFIMDLSPMFLPTTDHCHDHLITLSARTSTFGGIVRPICLAAFRLMMNSNFVGCSTGRSAGLAPFRILSTYVAARRSKSVMFTP